ncbi:MAG: DUF2179 domain-containing protein [Truepera sp.]|nr:DUF2179 domain-containing protein [Truepera sp.]
MTVELILGALLIFAMRVVDVSLGTLRIVMLVRGRRGLAGLLSFCESLIWLLAAGQVITNLDNPLQLVAFAGGYATGTMLGSTIERWIAMGHTLLRFVTPVSAEPVAPVLRERGFYVTEINATGRDGDVRVGFSVVPRRRVPEVLKVVHETCPNAFVTLEETVPANLAVMPAAAMRK